MPARIAAAYDIGKLNALMARLTRELDLPFVDLQAAFVQDWQRHGTRLEFPFDWHWNELGNDIVATVIADQIYQPRSSTAKMAVEAPLPDQPKPHR